MLSLALNDMAGLYARLGEADAAARCRRERDALNRAMAAFWDEEQGAYATYLTDTGRRHFCELTQALLVCAGAADGVRLDKALARLSREDNGLIPVTLSCSLFKYEALMRPPRDVWPVGHGGRCPNLGRDAVCRGDQLLGNGRRRLGL